MHIPTDLLHSKLGSTLFFFCVPQLELLMIFIKVLILLTSHSYSQFERRLLKIEVELNYYFHSLTHEFQVTLDYIKIKISFLVTV